MHQNLQKKLKEYWGYDSFRTGQLEVIESVLSRTDTIAVLPTGAGKSLCYQLPVIFSGAKCLVISPLIALIKDQISSLEKRGIKAIGIYSGQDKRTQDIQLDNAVYGDTQFIFVSPERLKSKSFIARYHKMNISLIVIDEAHCISEWGHDFRPAYRDIASIKSLSSDTPILALTATATEKVTIDIAENLKLKNYNSFIHSPVRTNLSYKCIKTENKKRELLHQVTSVDSSVIVYVDRRYLTHELQSFLVHRGIDCEAFHAGLDAGQRMETIERWNKNELRVIIATSAFGMGMDKADVRKVIHYNMPSSLEAYVQEAGRAGRDGEHSEAILFWNAFDLTQIKANVERRFPPIKIIRQIYHDIVHYLEVAVGNTDEEWHQIDLEAFAEKYNHKLSTILLSLKLIRDADYIQLSEKFDSPPKIRLHEAEVRHYLRDKNARSEVKDILTELLRSYEGICWDYKPIEESYLIRRLRIKPIVLNKTIQFISKSGLGDYQTGGRTFSINFLGFRHHSNNINLPDSIYRHRKERITEKLSSMINYLESENCRQRFIAEYFSIAIEKDCGICDNCTPILNRSEMNSLIADLEKQHTIQLHDILVNHTQANREQILRKFGELENERRIVIKNETIIFQN